MLTFFVVQSLPKAIAKLSDRVLVGGIIDHLIAADQILLLIVAVKAFQKGIT